MKKIFIIVLLLSLNIYSMEPVETVDNDFSHLKPGFIKEKKQSYLHRNHKKHSHKSRKKLESTELIERDTQSGCCSGVATLFSAIINAKIDEIKNSKK